MKIRILQKLPNWPDRVAELLIGCEVSLAHMMNPDGQDQSLTPAMCDVFNQRGPGSLSQELAGILGVEPRPASEVREWVPEHEVYVGEVLAAIGLRHGATVEGEAQRLLAEEQGAMILISQVTIPCSLVELVPGP